MILPAPGRLAAGIFGALALVFGASSWKLGFWVEGTPGPGLLPLATSALLLAAVACLLRAPPTAEEEPAISWRSLSGISLCGACALAMPWLGILIPAALLALLWMRLLGRRPWASSGLIALIMVAALALLFTVALRVPVPLWPSFG